MQRTLWKGAISFGLVNIPVGLYSAVKRNDLDFTMLDRRDFSPVGYRRVNKETGKEVPWEDIVKGYEYEAGQYVVLTDEDFRRANVEATQTVDILSFVRLDQISLIYFDTPYYLTPGKGGDKGYVLLRETLKRAERVAIAHVVIRSRQYLAALVPAESMLVLSTLRYADELRPMSEFDLPDKKLKAAGINEKEIALALRLVEGMAEEWDPEKYRDTYRDDILARVKEKIKAGQTEEITEPETTGVARKSAEIIDLMALLKRSVGTAGRSRHGGDGRSSKVASKSRARAVRRAPAAERRKRA